MSLDNVVRSVAGRLSLREPQAESLRKLAAALEAVPGLRDHQARAPQELGAMIEALKAMFSTLSDFERDFPSLCFALATGVGKTRLMGAFISTLHAAYGYKHFFVLAPNLTIYDKLIRDFTPNTPKYVFKGIAEFAATPPEVVTGDNYEQRGARSLLGGIEINIFNISKINTEVRGGRSPRIKRLSEYLGQSYFDYLAGLPDLVLLMDESHRYRASAGVRALSELKPVLSLELTATPFIESSRGPVPFKNVVMDYPLARAIEDGFVKEPAVVTQQNFDPTQHSAEQLERIKLMDGVRVHEETKVHLLTYAQQKGERPVKPFMLVIARDTTHASQLMKLISSELFGGRYAGKVIQVDSGTTSGAEGDEIVKKLLAVESYDEPTEIVIHVNMLKEGWDVTNLYTIVPLRAANARTLIEQSIGRGLRLPYGRKTGVEVVDRLNIIAHDRFQEVVDEAGRGDSPIRLKILKLDAAGNDGGGLRSVAVTPTINTILGITASNAMRAANSDAADGSAQVDDRYGAASTRTTVLYTGEETKVAQVVLDVIYEISHAQTVAPTSASLAQSTVQAEIVRRVQERITPAQAELLSNQEASIESAVENIVGQTVALLVQHTIDIPHIRVLPKGPIKSAYAPFALDVSKLNFQPQDQQLLSRGLQSAKQLLYGQSSLNIEPRLENYIVRELVNFEDLPYDQHAEYVQHLAGQVVAHFKTYLKTDDEMHSVLGNHGKAIAENVHAQMALQYNEEAGESEVIVSQGFTPLKPGAVTTEGQVLSLHQTPVDRSKIATMVYGDFRRCAYSHQKFHSDTERLLALVLERDSLLWFRPVVGQFNIFYRRAADLPEYVPDFVAAVDESNLLIETKKALDVGTEDVKAKAKAAVEWCIRASAYSAAYGGKPWKYLLIPHDAVAVNKTLSGLVATHEQK